MEFVRKRLKRAATLILAIGLVSQVAQAQPARCDAMNPAASPAGAMAHAHHPASSTSDSDRGTSRHHDSPASSSCIQSLLCPSNAALPAMPARVEASVIHPAVIDCAAPAIEARDLRPDSPPPKS